MHFQAKHLAYIPKVGHHFITSRLIPTMNVCEVTAKRALLNYAIIQDIAFDARQVIEDAILHNRDAKMNLGHAVHFQAKNLAYIPKVWHHFITSHLIPTMNVCEVKAKRALLNYAIIQDIPFDVGQVIEDVILYNQDAKMNLGHPFLIYGRCKQARVP